MMNNEDVEKVEMLVGIDRTDRSSISSIGRLFLTLYKRHVVLLSMLMLDHTTCLFVLKGS